MTTTPEPLMERAKALKLHGLLAHWEAVAATDWIAPLIGWEEHERKRPANYRLDGTGRISCGVRA
jgi:hypothetical protein